MSFAWHIFFILVGLLLQMWLIKCVYASSKTLSNKWDELLIDNNDRTLFNNRNASLLRSNNDDDDDDNSANENVTFDTMRLINNKHSMSSSNARGKTSMPI